MIRRALIYLRNFIIAVILLVITYLLWVVVINLNDQPPSETVIEFERVWHSKPKVADEDNGYLYFLGLDSPQHIDPLEIGIARSKWILEMNGASIDMGTDFPQQFDRLDESFSPELRAVFDQCKTIDHKCIALINENKSAIEKWFSENNWVLDRYQKLISHTAWQETPIENINMPLPRYALPIYLQELSYINLITQADRTSSEELIGMLGKDLTFWRNALANNDTIISKMISSAAIRNHFQWINFIFLNLKDEKEIMSRYADQLAPFNKQELSMRDSYIGEWFFIKNAYAYAAVKESMQGEGKSRYLFKFAYQEQDSCNRHAELLNQLINIVDVDIKDFETSIKQLDDKQFEKKSLIERYLSPYNFTGRVLGDLISIKPYASYSARVKDLEGARRALLTSMKLSINQEVDFTDDLFLNPYNHQPLQHNKEKRTISFTGLGQSGDRNIYQYNY